MGFLSILRSRGLGDVYKRQVLKKAMEIIDREREKRKRELLVKEKLETVVPIIESGLISNILLQEHFEEDLSLIHISEPTRPY